MSNVAISDISIALNISFNSKKGLWDPLRGLDRVKK